MKIAWCLQHVPFEGPGAFRACLEARGYEVKTRLVPEEGLPSNVGDFLLIMGGPMSVNDPHSWIEKEQQFVKSAIAQNIPVLGICFGAQLLAKTFGARITPGGKFEIGMTPIMLTEEGKQDSGFSGMPQFFSVFQWHGEGFSAPQDAVTLAASADYPVQAFRVGTQVYGLLFHLEIEEQGVDTLCQQCPDDITKGEIPPEVIKKHSLPHLPALHQMADRLIGHLTS